MKCALQATFFLLVVAVSCKALAAEGVVVLYKSSCDYFVVETLNGYAILQWYGGSIPNEGDKITGDFESYGMKSVANVTQGNETRVWVEKFWLSRARVIEKFSRRCR
jgi:hypothetical protein